MLVDHAIIGVVVPESMGHLRNVAQGSGLRLARARRVSSTTLIGDKTRVRVLELVYWADGILSGMVITIRILDPVNRLAHGSNFCTTYDVNNSNIFLNTAQLLVQNFTYSCVVGGRDADETQIGHGAAVIIGMGHNDTTVSRGIFANGDDGAGLGLAAQQRKSA